MSDQIEVSLADNYQNGDNLKVKVAVSGRGIEVFPENYGDFTSLSGHGSPVFLELYNGKLWLRVWADINQEDPTHQIDLSGALESNRKKD